MKKNGTTTRGGNKYQKMTCKKCHTHQDIKMVPDPKARDTFKRVKIEKKPTCDASRKCPKQEKCCGDKSCCKMEQEDTPQIKVFRIDMNPIMRQILTEQELEMEKMEDELETLKINYKDGKILFFILLSILVMDAIFTFLYFKY
jgi:hypothetical protein